MKKLTFLLLICLVLTMMLSACDDEKTAAVEPSTANAIIDGKASIGKDSEGNPVIENLTDGDYAEWIIEIDEKSDYDIEIEYAGVNEEFNCSAEIYSADGKLQAEVNLLLKGTGSEDTYKSITEEFGELSTGTYTFIIRPDNMEPESINIKSVKLLK